MSTTTRTKFHMGMDIEGLLRIYKDSDLRGLFNDEEGNPVSGKEAREILKSYLKKGWKVIPMCDADKCPDFDYFGDGCPGHEETIVEEKQ